MYSTDYKDAPSSYIFRELILRPVPRDPLQDLREIGKSLQGMSMEEIKRAIQEQADKEVDETLDRFRMKRIPLEE